MDTARNEYNKALNYYNNKEYEKAMEVCSSIIDKNPKDYQTYFLLGNIFVAINDFKTAQEFLYLALKINEDYFYPYDLLSNIYNKEGRIDLSIEILNLAIEKFYNQNKYSYQMAVTCTNMATLQNKLSNFDLAIQYAKKALKKDSKYIDTYFALARSYWMKCDIKNSEKYIKEYLKFNPNHSEIKFSYATLLLLNKNYKKGFEYYEERLKRDSKGTTHETLHFEQYRKNNKLEGKTLCLYQEQGYGDNIQFSRYLNEIKDTENISFLVHDSLYKLFKYNFPNINIIKTLSKNAYFDYKLALLSIPYTFNKNFVNSTSYLQVNENDIEIFIKKFINKNLKNIGIVWSSNQNSDYNEKRILDLDNIKELFSIPNTQFFSLQKECNEDLAKYNIVDLAKSFNDFYDTAVAISSLDLIISIDTSVAHLTGALGKKGYVLHNNDILDFRWDIKSGQSSWYDSLEIIKFSDVKETIKLLRNKLNE